MRDVILVLRSQYLPGIETFQFCFKISMSDQKGSTISNISISDLYIKTASEIPLRRTAVSNQKFSKARIIMRNSGGKFRDFKVQFQKSLN